MMSESISTSRIIRSKKPYRWEGIENDAYGDVTSNAANSAAGPVVKGIERHVLFGDECACSFHQRYFEIEPGGYSRLEKHQHVHCVVCVRGVGTILLDGKPQEIGFMDAVYVGPGAPHQLRNDGTEPFGFFCTVDAERDDPVPL